MHWGNTPGWSWGGWIMPTLMMLIVFGGMAALIVLLFVRQHAGGTPREADRILAERFARGDIDEDEYRRRLQALRRLS